MLISQESWGVSPGIELVRSGNEVTFNVSGSANGYYDEDLGYYLWDGDITIEFGDQYDYFYQYNDRPMDLSVTETLTPGVATTGYFSIYGDPSFYQEFSVILFDAAATYGGTAGVDYVFGSNQADTFSGAEGDDGFEAGLGNDWLNGGQGGDFLDGGDGRDTASYAGASAGVDARLYDSTLNGGDAAGDRYVSIEALEGSGYDDQLHGDGNGNTLDGGAGADGLYGLSGNDIYLVDNANDLVFEAASAGNDRVNASASYTLQAGQSVETLAAANAAATSALNLTGNEIGQRLVGNAGDNGLDGKGGADYLYGLGGNDTYRVDNPGDLVFEAVNAGFDRVNTSVSYRLAAGQSIERLSLTNTAGTQDFYIAGNEFGQTMTGNAGANIIDGGGGIDVLFGYGGADTFRFSTAFGNNNIDRIADFSSVDDTIRLDRSIFKALDLGMLSADAYKDISGGAVVDANDHILYDHDTGALFYDSNGSAAGGRYQFATLDNRPAALTAGDFFVVA